MSAVDLRVTNVRVDTRGYRINRKLQRGEGSLVGGTLGGNLVYGDAVAIQIDSERLVDRGSPG